MGIISAQSVNGLYMVTLASGTILWVPNDPLNADYIRLQAWVTAGGIIT
jgi:hypothetical protein